MHQSFRSGTTIAVLKGPEFIAVGADSKQIEFGNDASTRHLVINKIKALSPHAIFVSARLMGDLENYDSHRAASKAFSLATTLRDTAETFISISESKVKKMVEWLATCCPAYFAEHINGASALETLFAGVEGGIPKMYMVYFTAKMNDAGLLSITAVRNYKEDPHEFGIFFLGESKNANRLMDQEPKLFQSRGIPEGLRMLIKSEIEAMPHQVGPPIRTKIIHTNGTVDSAEFND